MGTVIVVMGVSGVGKTTVGQAFASRIGADFAEGDSYHPAENVEKMRSGRPLEDADRWPWLDRLHAEIERWLREDRKVVLTCSALKASYRDRLNKKGHDRDAGERPGTDGLTFVYLRAGRGSIEARLAARKGHYMPSSLLDSQLATLEPPDDAITIDADRPLRQILTELVPLVDING